MKKTTVALIVAAFLAATADPALAGCGGAHGKAYRAAQSAKKPTVAKRTESKNPAPVATTSAPEPTTIATGSEAAPNSTEL
jgi:hypothetical protein